MSRIKPEDDFCHEDYPRHTSDVWKENWYFNFIDIENKAWGMNHFSIRRDTQTCIFRANHVVDDELHFYENEIDIDEQCGKITDGSLSFEIIEPHMKHRLIFNGPKHQVDLSYAARFDLVDFAGDEKRGKSDQKRLHIEHYEQSMHVTGKITKDGQTRNLSCLGHRDHSWGFRNEELIKGWNWVAIQFPDQTFSFAKAKITDDFFMDGGHISDRLGSVRILKIKMLSTHRDDKGVPLGTTYKLEDAAGKNWTITSERFSYVSVPMKEKAGGVVHENFSSFVLEETGIKGIGIDEYMEMAQASG